MPADAGSAATTEARDAATQPQQQALVAMQPAKRVVSARAAEEAAATGAARVSGALTSMQTAMDGALQRAESAAAASAASSEDARLALPATAGDAAAEGLHIVASLTDAADGLMNAVFGAGGAMDAGISTAASAAASGDSFRGPDAQIERVVAVEPEAGASASRQGAAAGASGSSAAAAGAGGPGVQVSYDVAPVAGDDRSVVVTQGITYVSDDGGSQLSVSTAYLVDKDDAAAVAITDAKAAAAADAGFAAGELPPCGPGGEAPWDPRDRQRGPRPRGAFGPGPFGPGPFGPGPHGPHGPHDHEQRPPRPCREVRRDAAYNADVDGEGEEGEGAGGVLLGFLPLPGFWGASLQVVRVPGVGPEAREEWANGQVRGCGALRRDAVLLCRSWPAACCSLVARAARLEPALLSAVFGCVR